MPKPNPSPESNSELKDPRQFIEFWRNRFIELEKTGIVDGVKQGTVGNSYWQQVKFGEGVKGTDEQLYRGYLMVEPEKLPLALGMLAKVAEDRKARGKTTEFKWLLKTEEPDWINKITSGQGKPKDIGDYSNLKPEDPRIALYADAPQDILNILNALAQNRQWNTIEENRNSKYNGKASHRPGTNAFIDPSGREFRSLNYNDKPGYSEDQAMTPYWRMQKAGTPTGNL